jgi:hypothetical protein
MGLSNFRMTAPDGTLGYYRGDGEANRYGGTGSGKGTSMAGASRTLNQTQAASSGSNWTPSTGYLIALVIGEVLLFGFVRGLSKHGG